MDHTHIHKKMCIDSTTHTSYIHTHKSTDYSLAYTLTNTQGHIKVMHPT